MVNILPQLSIQVLAVRLIAGGTHMQYILLIHHDEQAWDKMDEATQKEIYGEFRQFREEFTASGHFLGGSQLQPSSATTTVRVRNGKRLVTDGPFAETREQLGGYILIDASGSRRGDRHRRPDSSGAPGHHRSPAAAARGTHHRKRKGQGTRDKGKGKRISD